MPAAFCSSWAWNFRVRLTTFLYFGCSFVTSTLTTIVFSPLSETTMPRRSWRFAGAVSGFGVRLIFFRLTGFSRTGFECLCALGARQALLASASGRRRQARLPALRRAPLPALQRPLASAGASAAGALASAGASAAGALASAGASEPALRHARRAARPLRSPPTASLLASRPPLRARFDRRFCRFRAGILGGILRLLATVSFLSDRENSGDLARACSAAASCSRAAPVADWKRRLNSSCRVSARRRSSSSFDRSRRSLASKEITALARARTWS